VVFIQTGSGTTAWTSPYVVMTKFNGGWDRYKSMQRTVTQWQTYFEALNSSPDVATIDIHKIGQATLTGKPSYTPFKIRRVVAEEASQGEGEEGVFVDEDAAEYVPIRPEDDSAIQWSAVANNMTWLHKSALAAKRNNEEAEELMEEMALGLEARIGEVRSLIGERKDSRGTATIFGILDDHSDMIDDLPDMFTMAGNRLAVLEAAPASDGDAVKAATKNELYAELNPSLEPLQKLYCKLSSRMDTPGDKLETEVSGIRSELTRLSSLIGTGTSGPTMANPPGFGWNLTNQQSQPTSLYGAPISGTLAPAANPLAGTVPSMVDIKSLERRMLKIEQQLASQAVRVGGQTFTSQFEAEAWLSLKCPLAGSHALFMDYHSLMAVAYGAGGTMAEVLKLEESKKKLGLSTSEEAILLASFHLEIPAFFGKPSTLATNVSSKVLPGLSNFAAWDAGDTDHGLRYDLRRKVQDRASGWGLSIETTLPLGEAQMVAQAMLHASTTFVEMVSNWITQFFRDCKSKGADEVETWKHISHTVREVCSILHDARRAGRGPFLSEGERATGLFWGQLQAHREMQIISNRGLMGDPRLSHILNLHLRDNAVMRSELVKFNDTIRILTKDVNELKNKNKRKAGGSDE
jgi:hypothetical protein